MTDGRQDELPPLEYATTAPRPKPAPTVAAAVFGVIAGLFGGIMLLYGIGGAIALTRTTRRVDGEDVFAVSMFILIGTLCEFFAARSVWAAVRR